jgi:molybdopterin-binding protein
MRRVSVHRIVIRLEENFFMKVSARNTLPGIVRKVRSGAVNAEVTIGVAPGLNIVSIITLDAVKNLGLKRGKIAYAVIKASSVLVGVD